MHHHTDRIVHTTVVFVSPDVEHWLEQATGPLLPGPAPDCFPP